MSAPGPQTISRAIWRNKAIAELKEFYRPDAIPTKVNNLIIGISYGLVEYKQDGLSEFKPLLDELEEAGDQAVRELVETLIKKILVREYMYGRWQEVCMVTRN